MNSGKYYISNGCIYGPKESGSFYILNGYIYGPKNSGKYYISDGYIHVRRRAESSTFLTTTFTVLTKNLPGSKINFFVTHMADAANGHE